jgi:Uncharacterized conserved protein
MTRTEVPVVRKQVVVNAPAEQAFTRSPRGSATSSRRSTTCSRPRSPRQSSSPTSAGTSTTAPSTAASAGGPRILAYEPPARVVFSWDISPQWQVETDPELTSEVEVRFVAEGPDRTRVELEHRHLDRHGPGWQSVSDGVDGDQGWPLYLARYAALFEGR